MTWRDKDDNEYIVRPHYLHDEQDNQTIIGYFAVSCCNTRLTEDKPTREEAIADFQQYIADHPELEIKERIWAYADVGNNCFEIIDIGYLPVIGEVITLYRYSKDHKYLVVEPLPDMPVTTNSIENYDEEIVVPIYYLTPWVTELICDPYCEFFNDWSDETTWFNYGCELMRKKITDNYGKLCLCKNLRDARLCARLGITLEQYKMINTK